jgi:hypothetical protein
VPPQEESEDETEEGSEDGDLGSGLEPSPEAEPFPFEEL